MKLTEKQIEDVFETYYQDLIEPGLTLVDRQHILENGLRIDLLFKDKKGKNVVLELKRDAITREDIGQTLQYAGLIKNSRVILAAPIIATSIKTAFEHYGIEYLEFDLKMIESLIPQLSAQDKDPKTLVSLPQNIVKVPLQKQKLVDGNVAFKVTYNDNNWEGVCSYNLAQYNFQHRTFCKVQSVWPHNCQDQKWKKPGLNYGFPCYDSGVLKTLAFFAGHYHGPKHKLEPKRALNIKKGKIAVFTSREPGEPESERFIIAIGEIDFIDTVSVETGQYEEYYCNPESAIVFLEEQPKFWKYYRNPNNPDRIAWNTGLYRYMNDSLVVALLEDIVDGNWDSETISRAKNLLESV